LIRAFSVCLESSLFNHIGRVCASGLDNFHFILGFAFLQAQDEFDLFAVNKVRFGLAAQFIEVCRFKEELEQFQLFGEFFVFALLEKLAQGLVVESLRLSFNAGVQFRFEFYVDLSISFKLPLMNCFLTLVCLSS